MTSLPFGVWRRVVSNNRKITITNSIAPERGAAPIVGRGARVRLETIAVRAGAEIDRTTGALAPPPHLSTAFEHGPASEAIHGFLYVRYKTPPQLRLEAASRGPDAGLADEVSRSA